MKKDNLIIRMSEEKLTQLQAVAKYGDFTVSELARRAIDIFLIYAALKDNKVSLPLDIREMLETVNAASVLK